MSIGRTSKSVRYAGWLSLAWQSGALPMRRAPFLGPPCFLLKTHLSTKHAREHADRRVRLQTEWKITAPSAEEPLLLTARVQSACHCGGL